MNNQFTKQEALNLFGSKVRFKETLYFEQGTVKYPIIEKGFISHVYLIENDSCGIKVTFLIDEQYHEFSKQQFERYCELMDSCSAA